MMKSSAINKNQQNLITKNLASDIYFLPNWEMIKSFSLNIKQFFFFNKLLSVSLYRKLSIKSDLEKYSIRSIDNINLANMDIKMYKDCVYIVNLEMNANSSSSAAVKKLIQTAMEKANSETTEKEVLINISPNLKYKRKIKKILVNCGFQSEINQSEYEKNMFGEIYKAVLKDENNNREVVENKNILIAK